MINILSAGPLVTLQDRGRHGLRHLGVTTAGAMDSIAFEAANAVAGNRRPLTALEIPPVSLELESDSPLAIAYSGPAHTLCCDAEGHRQSWYPNWRYSLEPGQRLRLSPSGQGMYGYLAVAGGVEVAPQLGSVATDLQAGIGGLNGRALQAGDRLPVGPSPPHPPRHRGIRVPGYDATLRFIPCSRLAENTPSRFDCRLSSSVSRMGVRLQCQSGLPSGYGDASVGVFAGAIQRPSDDTAIILTADCQTTGGYPLLGYLARADLPKLVQLVPGQACCLSAITSAQAAVALAKHQHWRHQLLWGLYAS
ncbi:biotin-dependent carboxyltransferase family protein [Ferrimonas kyonanensis]|uniref:5-oxoprolinase subunit C family protein n=1 Tax=Ferrimonas kyonanensis TaxID=364763 RepID=UPI000420EB89|nr:biotin-dependent carboxyltransferase family protein [Ferrimonas kyonanensis]